MIPNDLRPLDDVLARIPGQNAASWRQRARRGVGPDIYKINGTFYVSQSEAEQWVAGCSLRAQFEVATMRARHPQADVVNRRAKV